MRYRFSSAIQGGIHSSCSEFFLNRITQRKDIDDMLFCKVLSKKSSEYFISPLSLCWKNECFQANKFIAITITSFSVHKWRLELFVQSFWQGNPAPPTQTRFDGFQSITPRLFVNYFRFNTWKIPTEPWTCGLKSSIPFKICLESVQLEYCWWILCVNITMREYILTTHELKSCEPCSIA